MLIVRASDGEEEQEEEGRSNFIDFLVWQTPDDTILAVAVSIHASRITPLFHSLSHSLTQLFCDCISIVILIIVI